MTRPDVIKGLQAALQRLENQLNEGVAVASPTASSLARGQDISRATFYRCLEQHPQLREVFNRVRHLAGPDVRRDESEVERELRAAEAALANERNAHDHTRRAFAAKLLIETLERQRAQAEVIELRKRLLSFENVTPLTPRG